MAAATTPTYVLGHADNEFERLALQGQYWGEVTLDVLRRAGLAPGMHVLDVGCGAGDVSLIAANLVGPTGSVLGIDRSGEAVERATTRAASLEAVHCRFQVGELEAMDPAVRFDVVIGRFVLMYLPDPAAALRRLVGSLRPGGVVAFLEMDMRAVRSVPPVPEIEAAIGWLRETFERAGVALDLGARLWRVFRDAGLPAHELVVCQKLDPPTSAAGVKLLAQTVQSALPLMERLGVATKADVGIESLADTLHEAQLRDDAALFTPCVIGAYGRVAVSPLALLQDPKLAFNLRGFSTEHS